MKKIYLSLILCTLAAMSHAQWSLTNYINFDAADTFNHLVVIDTTHYHHNIWQVGAPHKTHFTTALSAPNAIVTDTANVYPPNDTSAFIVKMPCIVDALHFSGWPHAPAIYFGFSYSLDKGRGSSATVEISRDGVHWYYPADTALPFMEPVNPMDTLLNETSITWQQYFVSFKLDDMLAMTTSDTLRFRFTFISDSATPGRDGWMIDNITLGYYSEGLQKIRNNDLISLYPNPSQGNVYIHAITLQAAAIAVYDMRGVLQYSVDALPTDGLLHLPLAPGAYLLHYSTADAYAIKRLVITK